MNLKIYEYKNCDNCRKALQFLEAQKTPYQKIAIVDQPPTLAELQKMLVFLKAQGLGLQNLFNTSGVQYRELNISQKLKEGLSEDEALQMLAKNGKLIKRPFLLGPQWGLVGFKKETWSKFL